MDANQTKRFPFFKLFLGLLAIIAVVVGAVMVEKNISKAVKDVTINKSEISGHIKYIKVKPLSTRIMAVKTDDGEIHLAFDECLSCYYNNGVKGSFSDTGESVVCSECGCETFYEDMGLLSDECTPIPILADYTVESADTVTVPKEFLETCKDALNVLRSGKGNYKSIYGESDFRNMEITEASDAAVAYDAPDNEADEIDVDALLSRTEDITKLYNGYLNDVTLNASQSDIGVYTACYDEFILLCDELADTRISNRRASEIGKKFDEIESKLREIGKKSEK